MYKQLKKEKLLLKERFDDQNGILKELNYEISKKIMEEGMGQQHE
jgi:hypothetical protein